MDEPTTCNHDFLAILHCKTCGEQFHTDWMKAVQEAKLEAVDTVLTRLKTTIEMKSTGKTTEEATRIALQSLKEVRKIFDESKTEFAKTNNKLKVTFTSTD